MPFISSAVPGLPDNCEFRRAEMSDLARIRAVFEDIKVLMAANGIDIWDEIYPCDFFAGDIEEQRLYILCGGDDVIAAFALCPTASGADRVRWERQDAAALYLDRIGVNTAYRRCGVGTHMLEHAVRIARQSGVDYLRLFVVDINTPAIDLYRRYGFRQSEGFFDEQIDDDITLREYGFEYDVRKNAHDISQTADCNSIPEPL